MAINVSVRYNGGLLPGIVLLTQQCYHHRNPFKCHEEVLYLQSMMIPPKRFDPPPPLTGGCSEGPDAFRFSLKQVCPDNVLTEDAFSFFFKHQTACFKKNQNAPRPF